MSFFVFEVWEQKNISFLGDSEIIARMISSLWYDEEEK